MPPKKKARQLKRENVIGVIDYETDPFLYGRIPAPFVAGFYSAEVGFKYFWGKDCVMQLLVFLEDLKTPHTIYAHNGGKFDFFLMLEHLENPIKIINGRIVKAQVGVHTLQDSYAMIPIPLGAFDKDEFDYTLLEDDVRDQHREAIIKYLRKDCTSLFELVSAFRERFGDRLTIGGTAIAKLKEMHPFDTQKQGHDERFRPYYFGGRVEAFETGIIRVAAKVYDVNSMYPYVMHEFHHPTGSRYTTAYSGIVDKRGRISGFADAKVFFARIHCQQQGAFPVRVKDRPLDFNVPEGEFFVTSHELQAAVATGRVQNIKVLEVRAPAKTIQFKQYVDLYSAEKIAAKRDGNKAAEIFAKLLLNSAYGKFGQNPEHYFDYTIVGEDDPIPDAPWELYFVGVDLPQIWRKPSDSRAYYDVATAASITGAARSVLMRALAIAERPLYCDTDSIICAGFPGDTHDSRLGAWKYEGEGDRIAIAGKKLYALRQGSEFVKIASKGARLTGQDIFEICSGGEVHWHNDAPSFSLSKPVTFVQRKIKVKK